MRIPCPARLKTLSLITVSLITLFACSDSDQQEEYPPIVTEFASILTDKNGTMTSMTTDDDVTYPISNKLNGYAANALYRVVCGYEQKGNGVYVYQLYGAFLLRDSSEVLRQDPVNVTSLWRKGHFLNLIMESKTQGQTQLWGYATDSITPGHTYLTLHHHQNGDPEAYTATIYASIPLDSLKQTQASDTITLRVNTYNGEKVYTIK